MLRQNSISQHFEYYGPGVVCGLATVAVGFSSRPKCPNLPVFISFFPCLYYKIKKMRGIMLFFKEKTLYLRVFKRNKINHNKI